MRGARSQPYVAGVVTALVGFSSTFALVLTGLRSVGASSEQASSGLLAVCVIMGVLAIVFAFGTRMPVSIAWSTPGAALLLSTGAPDGGYAAAVGAFLVCGLLLLAAGLSTTLGRWIEAIPRPLASAMLAGVLLPICIAPAKAVAEIPGQAVPVVAAWLALLVVARRWAVPGAIAVTAIVILVADDPTAPAEGLLPALTWTTPSFDAGAIVGLALPLFLVTMASQNITGMTVLASFGYRPRLGPVLVGTGGGTAIGAPFGVFSVNLAAISAALVAGPDGGDDPDRRWIGAAVSGVAYFALGLSAGAAAALLAAAPPLLIQAAAGLALLGALAAAMRGAMAADSHREAAIVTLVVSASAITIAGISAPFWGLLAGLAVLGAERLRAAVARPSAA